MPRSFIRGIFLTLALTAGASATFAQDASSRGPGSPNRSDEPRTVKEMLAKQRVERDRKDHAEMLRRGEEALAISRELERAFEKSNTVSAREKEKLESLEKIVSKIRKELGGDNDGEAEVTFEVKEKPSSLRDAFKYLQSTTVKMVDELKKTSRFSVSVVAIQSSNTVLQIVRFLRLRK